MQLRTRRAEIKRFDSGGGVELLRRRPPSAEAERASNAGPHRCAPHVACASLDAMRWRMRRVAALQLGLLETELFRARETRQTRRRLYRSNAGWMRTARGLRRWSGGGSRETLATRRRVNSLSERPSAAAEAELVLRIQCERAGGYSTNLSCGGWWRRWRASAGRMVCKNTLNPLKTPPPPLALFRSLSTLRSTFPSNPLLLYFNYRLRAALE